MRYCLSDDSAFCVNCIAFCGQISETTPGFAKSWFRDRKNAAEEQHGDIKSC